MAYLGFSMSVRAGEAYNSGLVPASKISGIPAKLIRQHCQPREWHHTSSRYNRTDFYVREEVLAVFGISESENYPFEEYRSEPAACALKASKAKSESDSTRIIAGPLWYAEWGGTRNRPTREVVAWSGSVELKGDWAVFHMSDGSFFRKKLTNVFISEKSATDRNGISVADNMKWFGNPVGRQAERNMK